MIIKKDETNSDTGYSAELELPATLKKVKVTSIDDETFKDCYNITKVRMGNNITKVGAKAFMGLNQLKSITLTDKITEIGEKAFGYNNDTQKITGFKIYAVKDSAAYQYAIDNSFSRDYILTDVYISDVIYPVDTEKANTSSIYIKTEYGTVKFKQWYKTVGDSNEIVNNGTAFASGNFYTLRVEFTPPQGTYYSEYIDKSNIHINNSYTATELFQEDGKYVMLMRYNKLSPKADITINDVTLTGMTKPVIGEKAVVPNIKMAASQGTIVNISWLHENGMKLKEDEEFEFGKVYKLNVDLKPNMYYVYADKGSLNVTFDGKKATYIDILGNDNTGRTYTTSYQFEPLKRVIDEIAITGVKAPEIDGSAAADSTLGSVVLSPDYGTIYAKYWGKLTGTDSWATVKDTETYEIGGEYAVIFRIDPPDGCKFSESLKATINDQEAVVDIDGSNTNRRFVKLSFGILKRYIDKIEITGATAPETGKAPTITGIGSTVASGCKFVDRHWEVKDGLTSTPMNDGDVFEKGKTYSLVITIEPAEELTYYSDSTVVTVDGKNATSFETDPKNESRYNITYTYDTIPNPDTTAQPTATPSATGAPDSTNSNQSSAGGQTTQSPANNVAQTGSNTVTTTQAGQATDTQSSTTGAQAQNITVKAATKTVKLAKVRKAKQVVAKCITVKNAFGKITYKKVAKGSASVLTINKNTGKITVKKGTYKIKVKVTAAGDGTHASASKTVTVKIKVK